MVWHGYFSAQRITANLNESNWAALVDEINRIVGVGNLPHQILHKRCGANRFNMGTEEAPEWYSDIYVYEANFNDNAVSFDKFTDKLAALFEVNPENVTYTTATETLRDRPTVVATYKYLGKGRIRIALLGCASDSELCAMLESRTEAHGLFAVYPDDWD